MKNKIGFAVAFMFVILTITFVNATIENLGTFQQFSCITLKQNANSNYSLCNITSVLYPNSSMSLGPNGMTKIGTDYNYSNYCKTSVIGTYIVNGFCDNGQKQTWSYTFYITPTGDNRGFGIFIVLIVIAFLLFATDYFVDTGYLTFLSGTLFLVTGVYAMIYGIAGLSELWTRAIALIMLGVGFIFMLGSAYELVWGENES